MKGANYIPADSFVARVDDGRYRFLMQSAADAHMNMVRVWGGGIYEDERFYDLCDEMGILVWQDFMFACSMYPATTPFLENVRQEAIENVRRLRNHPSLALWAGNNEMEGAWQSWGWPAEVPPRQGGAGRRSAATTSACFTRSSRGGGRRRSRAASTRAARRARTTTRSPANQLGYGDMHYWGVWHAEAPYKAYGANMSRFMSEYGFQSFPELRDRRALRRRPPTRHRIAGHAGAPAPPARQRRSCAPTWSVTFASQRTSHRSST